MKDLREDTKNITYHAGKIPCDKCKRKFCNLIRNESFPDDKFCMNCYGERYGTAKTTKVLGKMNNSDSILWETPFDELPEYIKKAIEPTTIKESKN